MSFISEMSLPLRSADFWIYKLFNVLRPPPQGPLTMAIANSRSACNHPPGEIWRHILSSSVYRDLSGLSWGTADTRSPWRRFVRIECIGLSGVLLYEIYAPSQTILKGDVVEDGLQLTLRSVFGDPHNSDDSGMNVDDLLDAVCGKVVYFPSYACTSFIAGQAMHASLLDRPALRPVPAIEWFSVLSSGYLNESVVLEHPLSSSEDNAMDFEDGPDILFSSEDYPGEVTDDLLRRQPQHEDPLMTLCVRLSKVGPTRYSSINNCLDEIDYCDDSSPKEDSDSSVLTIDSDGPDTPPNASMDDMQAFILELPAAIIDFSSKSLKLLADPDSRLLTSFLDLECDEATLWKESRESVDEQEMNI